MFAHESERRVVAVESKLDNCGTILSDGIRPSSPMEVSDMSKWLGVEGMPGPGPGNATGDRHYSLRTSIRAVKQGF